MNQIFGATLKIIRARRFGFLALAACLALLLSASTGKAGCAVPYKGTAAPAPRVPFVSPHDDGESNQPATIVGLWHVLYTANSDDNFPPEGPFRPHPFRSSNPSRPGTRMELNLKTHFFHPPAGISALESGRKWATIASSCTISV
jgi:hypothetical protein